MIDQLKLERRGNIAIISLNRPDKLNALSLEMIKGLIDMATRLRRDRDLRGIIIKGDGKAFCAGMDLQSIFSSPGKKLYALTQLIRPHRGIFQQVNLIWRNLPVPVIAVINGHCYGAGMQLALGADMILASPETKLSLMETKWGMIPDMGAMITLRDRLRRDQAKELITTARIIDAETALAHGLITRVTNDPLEAAIGLLEEIGERSPDAVAAAKRLVDASWNASPWYSLLLERFWQLRLILGTNHRIAVRRNTKQSDFPYRPRSIH